MRRTATDRTRRQFLATASCGVLGALGAWSLPPTTRLLGEAPRARPGSPRGASDGSPTSRASITHGEDRAENTYRALKLIERDVRAGLRGKKRVVIKPNMVSVSRQLAATHADCLEGLLEFFAPLEKEGVVGEIVIAESPAGGTAAEGYSNYGYTRLEKEYKVRFLDLDLQPMTFRHVTDERFYPRRVRFSKYLLDPDTYLVSAAVMKTHDRAIVTLGLKNVAVGAILKDTTFRWGRGSRGTNDKPLAHGGRGNEGIHYNLFQLARELPPALTLLDGYQAMEGNGPVGGTPVDHRLAVASTDWLAADRIAVELMGFELQKIGYLRFAAEAGFGQGDLARIEVLGEKVADHVRTYRPHDSVERQYGWMKG